MITIRRNETYLENKVDSRQRNAKIESDKDEVELVRNRSEANGGDLRPHRANQPIPNTGRERGSPSSDTQGHDLTSVDPRNRSKRYAENCAYEEEEEHACDGETVPAGAGGADDLRADDCLGDESTSDCEGAEEKGFASAYAVEKKRDEKEVEEWTDDVVDSGYEEAALTGYAEVFVENGLVVADYVDSEWEC